MASRSNRTQSLQPNHIVSNKLRDPRSVATHRSARPASVPVIIEDKVASGSGTPDSGSRLTDPRVAVAYLEKNNTPFSTKDQYNSGESSPHASPIMASPYSNVKRYPTVIEEVFVLRDENEEVPQIFNVFVSIIKDTNWHFVL